MTAIKGFKTIKATVDSRNIAHEEIHATRVDSEDAIECTRSIAEVEHHCELVRCVDDNGIEWYSFVRDGSPLISGTLAELHHFSHGFMLCEMIIASRINKLASGK